MNLNLSSINAVLPASSNAFRRVCLAGAHSTLNAHSITSGDLVFEIRYNTDTESNVNASVNATGWAIASGANYDMDREDVSIPFDAAITTVVAVLSDLPANISGIKYDVYCGHKKIVTDRFAEWHSATSSWRLTAFYPVYYMTSADDVIGVSDNEMITIVITDVVVTE